jgi:glyoxylase-like metal-dependent hydrolase (beta-lactamase superfamily II)
MLKLKLMTAALLLSTVCHLTLAHAMEEPPSTINAKYVEPSITKKLAMNERISHLYERNQGDGYILQLLNDKTYFFQRHHYATTFVVGKNGVLLFDPLENQGQYILQAIKKVTHLPVTAIVYSHGHFDHIGDAQLFADQAKKNGIPLRIIASQKTADKLAYIKSKLPMPTETVAWPNGKFKFENQTVELHGFKHPTHTDDHGVWLLVQQKVLHAADHMNPDQLPFWRFGASETFLYYEDNLKESQKLNWKYINAGHGNVGTHEDYPFIFKFINDLKKSVSEAAESTKWGTGVDASKVNTHAAYLATWYNIVSKKAVDTLRPMYGKYYGFEYSTPSNAEMVALDLHEYR